MNWLRKLVSGKRRRLVKDEFDLDITYITRRILAMSFPASGIEKMYRNAKSDVINYLDKNHGGHYKIYNMSGRSYDTTKYHGPVENYDWEDHHAPEMRVLFQSCHSMYEYLLEDDDNVIVVHWNAGKGRTGTSIACFLIYSGLASSSEDAITYYGRKRFSHGKGITQPSQVRYVQYFDAIYKRKVQSPVVRRLKSLNFSGVPWLYGKTSKLYFEILEAKTMEKIYSSKEAEMLKYEFLTDEIDRNHWYELIPADDLDMHISGDLLFRLKNGSGITQGTLCRFSINVAFLGDYLVLGVDKLDPNSFKKDNRFPTYFKMRWITERICKKCDGSKPLNDLCQNCVRFLENELPAWSYIQGILHDLEFDGSKKPSYKRALNLHFLGTEPDYEATLNLDPKDISKITLITGSVKRDNNNVETISINFFGRRLTVSK